MYTIILPGSTSADLDDTSQYPLFARTVPNDAGTAIPIIHYFNTVLKANHLVVVNVNDAYGNAFVGKTKQKIPRKGHDKT